MKPKFKVCEWFAGINTSLKSTKIKFISYNSSSVILKLSAIPSILETTAQKIVQSSSCFLVQEIHRRMNVIFLYAFWQ